jgi:hypothetical protein
MPVKTLVLTACLALVPAAVTAQESNLKATVDSTVAIHAQTQRQQDDWASERAELSNRYRNLDASLSYLSAKREATAARLAALAARRGELERSIAESARLQAGLQDTLLVVMRKLEAAVAADLPFLAAEREARLSSLRQELMRPEVAGAEKLRRLLEALVVEAEYGGSIEVYQEPIVVGGETIHADLLRIGRISAFWRTADGERVGEFDRASRQWVELPGKYNRDIATAMEMAARLRPIQIVELPLGRIAP